MIKVLTNDLYYVKNVDTGKVYYCMMLAHVREITGFSYMRLYKMMDRPEKDGTYNGWHIKSVDGTNIPYGQIYKQ